jgi:hypothetical protein
MYVQGNPKSKKALKELVAQGEAYVFSPGPFPAKENGREFVEGPHYPEPHRWYAQVEVKDGVIVKVVS